MKQGVKVKLQLCTFQPVKNITYQREIGVGKNAEIDIISQDEKTLVFVEVKTRSTERYGQPKEFISLRKEALMKETAEAYLEINELELEVCFDIISIVQKNRTPKIEHVENVF